MAEPFTPAIVINAPVLPPPIRHQTLFAVFDVLPVAHSVLLVNDHDPKPLIYQLQAEQPDVFTVEYLEAGPQQFSIKVTRNKA